MNATTTRLSDLLTAVKVVPLEPPHLDPAITGAQLDSRLVEAGDLFFALRGERHDGAAFVKQAVAQGARAIVAESDRPADLDSTVAWVRVAEARGVAGPIAREVYGRPDQNLTLVGITGTNGKTTVSYMVQSIAAAAGRRAGRIGTTGYAFEDLVGTQDRTTPEAPELYRRLRAMRDSGADLVAMEVSAHALSLGRVGGAEFSAAVFLNLTRDHMDYYHDEERYFGAKAALFADLAPDQNGIVPADSDWGRRLAELTQAKLLSFGRSADADLRLSDERCALDGSTAMLSGPTGRFEIRIRIPGRFNLDNAAAAAACAIALGISTDAITDGLERLDCVPGRVQRIDRGQPFEVWVDYAHTPDALDRMLRWAAALVSGRLLVVFGCGGDRDQGKRSEMGRTVAQHADISFITSDNPRGEDPLKILREVRAGVELVEGALWHCIADRREAIETAITRAQPGDLVVLAGKGHETTQDVGGRIEPFDDREVAATVLANRATRA